MYCTISTLYYLYRLPHLLLHEKVSQRFHREDSSIISHSRKKAVHDKHRNLGFRVNNYVVEFLKRSFAQAFSIIDVVYSFYRKCEQHSLPSYQELRTIHYEPLRIHLRTPELRKTS